MTSYPIDAFRRQHGRLLALSRRWLGNAADAEDAVQDVWLRVQPGVPEQLANETAWLVTVLRHVCIDRLRRRHAETRFDSAGETDIAPSAEETAAASLGAQALLRRLVAHVPATDLAALLLHEVFGFGHAELGTMARQSTVAMRQRVHRAHQRVHSGDLRSEPDREAQEMLFSLCWRALRQRDAAGLIAQLRGGPRQLRAGTTTTVPGRHTALALALALAPQPARAIAALVHVDGAFALACVFDGIVLCTVPLGPIVRDEEAMSTG